MNWELLAIVAVIAIGVPLGAWLGLLTEKWRHDRAMKRLGKKMGLEEYYDR